LAAPCSGRGNCPPKAVSEPPASVKCKPFHFVSTRKYPLFSMYHDPGIHPKIYLPFECTSFQPSAVRQLLISSAESELSFRSQLCPGKWQEDSVIFSLLPLMSAVTSYYLKMNSKAKQCSFDIIYREEVKCTRVVEIFFIGLSEDATKGAREPLHRIAYNTLGGIF